MTTTNPPDYESRLRSWACRQLEHTAPAPWSAVGAAFLSRLELVEFCPSPAQDFALRVLADGGGTDAANLGWQQAHLDIENELRDKVEQLAAGWFSIGAEDRKLRCEELYVACDRFPELKARLEELLTGVDIDPSELTGPQGQLAAMLAELFVLRPVPRAERRRELLIDLEENLAFWDTTAQELSESQPRMAALEPVFLDAILGRKLHAERVRTAKKAYAKSPKPAAASSGSQWHWLLIAFSMISLIRLGSVFNNQPAAPPRPAFLEQQQWRQNFGNREFLDDMQKKMHSGKWILQKGKLVPIEDTTVQPRVKSAPSPPTSDAK